MDPFRENCLLHQEIIFFNLCLRGISFQMMYNISGLRHRFSNELLEGGGGNTYLHNSLAMTNQEGQFEVSDECYSLLEREWPEFHNC